jgi:hypothetical protein
MSAYSDTLRRLGDALRSHGFETHGVGRAMLRRGNVVVKINASAHEVSVYTATTVGASTHLRAAGARSCWGRGWPERLAQGVADLARLVEL